jgi:transposase
LGVARVLRVVELTRVSCTHPFLGRKMCMPSKYDPNVKAKAIRLVREHAGDYPTEYAAITAVAGRLGMTPETLRKWIRQAEVDEGKMPGTTTAESAQIRELKRKNRELEQTIEILKAATSFFARECDPRQS